MSIGLKYTVRRGLVDLLDCCLPQACRISIVCDAVKLSVIRALQVAVTNYLSQCSSKLDIAIFIISTVSSLRINTFNSRRMHKCENLVQPLQNMSS